jgi:hypothetical protein
MRKAWEYVWQVLQGSVKYLGACGACGKQFMDPWAKIFYTHPKHDQTCERCKP